MQSRFTLSLGILLLVFASVGPACADHKHILILSSYGRDLPPWAEFTRKFRAELEQRSPDPVEFHDASLATGRFATAEEERPFVDYLEALFANRSLDMIVAVGAPAARFVQQHRPQIFPAVPMLFTAVDERRLLRADLTANDTAVTSWTDIEAAFNNILRVLPATTHIAVVTGNSPNELYWRDQIRAASQPYATQVAFSWLSDLSFDDMLKRVASLPPNSAIFFNSVSVDAAGASLDGNKAFDRLRAVANAPMFSYIDANFGSGLVGGPIVSLEEIAREAASVVIRILGGEVPGEIKTPTIRPGIPKFDWRELQRWNISESRLPPGSEIRFRTQSFWEQYRLQLGAVLLVVLFQAAIIFWLLFERHRRQASETESRARLRQLIHLDRVAGVGAISASFAHELNQPLGAIMANAEAAEILMGTSPVDHSQIMEILGDIRRSNRHAGDMIAHLRLLLKRRDAIELQEFDLNDALRDALLTVNSEARKKGVMVSVYQIPGALPVRADQIHLEQVVINLASNAMDAMQDSAPAARIMTVQTALLNDSEVEVSVSDSGTGIPEDKLEAIFEPFVTTKQQGNGLGLSIARTIMENYGGKIHAENRPAGGAVFRFTLPLTKARPG